MVASTVNEGSKDQVEQINISEQSHEGVAFFSYLNKIHDAYTKARALVSTKMLESSKTRLDKTDSFTQTSQDYQSKFRFREKYINCMLGDIDFMNKKVHMFLFLDITLVQQQEKEKLEVKFKNIFLSSISHNLKTPINSKFAPSLID